jgi:hypothetical protein
MDCVIIFAPAWFSAIGSYHARQSGKIDGARIILYSGSNHFGWTLQRGAKMRRRMLALGVLALGVLAAGVAMSTIGCSSASNATDSTFSYIRGDQRATLGAAPPQITDATLAAAQELELPVDAHSADGLVGKVLMHTSDGAKVEVNIKGEANDQSEVTVRVGTFGDKVLQQRVLDKIKSHLTPGASPAVATQTLKLSPTPIPAPTASPQPSVLPTIDAGPAPMPAPVAKPAPPAAAPFANPLAPANPPVNPPTNPLAPTAPPATMPSGF